MKHRWERKSIEATHYEDESKRVTQTQSNITITERERERERETTTTHNATQRHKIERERVPSDCE